MFYALGWFVVLGLLALWSLAAWAIHGITAWTLANAGVLASGTAVTGTLRLPDWLAPWIPQEVMGALESMASGLMPAVQAALAWMPSLEGGLTVVVWMVWGLGAAVLVVMGLLASGLIAVLRRASSPPGAPLASPTAAR